MSKKNPAFIWRDPSKERKEHPSFIWTNPVEPKTFLYPSLPVEQRQPEILLQPNIVNPLHGVNPRLIMGKGWWDRKRYEAYEKYDHHCDAIRYATEEDMPHRRKQVGAW